MNVKSVNMKDVLDYVKSVSQEEYLDKVHEVISDVRVLLDRVSDILNDNPIIMAAAGIGFTACLSSAGSADIIMCLGSEETIRISARELVLEASGMKKPKDVQKDSDNA